MKVQLLEKPAIVCVGVSTRVSTLGHEHNRAIPAFWANFYAEGKPDLLMALSKTYASFGICHDWTAPNAFTYTIATDWDEAKPIPSGFERVEIPAATWAVFPAVGALPASIQRVWAYVYEEWFAANPAWEHAGGPEMESYSHGDIASPDYYCEVWIPIRKKVV
jgi:AraC family transcriptional regulator